MKSHKNIFIYEIKRNLYPESIGNLSEFLNQNKYNPAYLKGIKFYKRNLIYVFVTSVSRIFLYL